MLGRFLTLIVAVYNIPADGGLIRSLRNRFGHSSDLGADEANYGQQVPYEEGSPYIEEGRVNLIKKGHWWNKSGKY